MRIAFIGGGVMGESLIKSILSKRISSPNEITVSDIVESRRKYFQKTYNIKTVSKNSEAIQEADVVVLAIKPQDINAVTNELKEKLKPSQLVLSIVAGITLDTLQQNLNHNSIVRSMPNMPAQIGAGITVWTDTPKVTVLQKKRAQSILGAMGEELYLNNEKYIDMATAISGCGPAYIFMILEALIDAGVHIGLTRSMSEKLVLETTIGSARTVKITGKHPAELKNQVTSPGGITAEGLLQLESGGLRSLLLKAVISAYEKAKKIANQ